MAEAMDVWETLKSTMCKASEGKSRLDAVLLESDDDEMLQLNYTICEVAKPLGESCECHKPEIELARGLGEWLDKCQCELFISYTARGLQSESLEEE